MKNKPDYANLRIAHGKDRCANPPRSGPQGGSGGMRRSASGNNASIASPKVEITEDMNGAGGFEFVDDSGLADADAAVGNAEMLMKAEDN